MVQNVLHTIRFCASLVESKMQVESYNSMEAFAAAQFMFPCFSLTQAQPMQTCYY